MKGQLTQSMIDFFFQNEGSHEGGMDMNALKESVCLDKMNDFERIVGIRYQL